MKPQSLLLPALFAAVFLAANMPPAQAHGYLVESFPQKKAHLKTPPHQVRLRFSVRADALYSTLSIEGENGAVIASKTQQVASQDFQMPAPELAPGRYQLKYRILSPDGDLLGGAIDFQVED
jgi:copper resistance protein C